MNFRDDVWRLVSGLLLDPGITRDSICSLLDACDNDWTQIIRLSDLSLATPALAVNLDRMGLLNRVPPDARRYLESVKQMNLARNQALKAQLDEAIVALNAAGIVPTLLKGAAHLQLDLYEHAASRMTADLDLLIDKNGLLEAQRVLAALGYETRPAEDMNYARHHHTPPLCRAGEYASVELHEEPLNWRARGCLDTSELWSRSVEHRDGALCFRTPCPTDAVVLTIAHAEIVNRSLRQLIIDLRSLQDVARLEIAFGDQIDWHSIEKRFSRQGHAHIYRAFLLIMKRLNRSEQPDRPFDTQARLRYFCCRVALRNGWLRPWIRRVELLTTARIRSRLGPGHNWLAVNKYRIATLCDMCRRGTSRMTKPVSRHVAPE